MERGRGGRGGGGRRERKRCWGWGEVGWGAGGGERCRFPLSRISTHAVGGVGGGEGAGARSEGGRERGSLRETERERGDRLQPPHDRSRAGRKARKGERETDLAPGGRGRQCACPAHTRLCGRRAGPGGRDVRAGRQCSMTGDDWESIYIRCGHRPCKSKVVLIDVNLAKTTLRDQYL